MHTIPTNDMKTATFDSTRQVAFHQMANCVSRRPSIYVLFVAFFFSSFISTMAETRIEQVQRDFQTRHRLVTGNFIQWPKCSKGSTPAPQFPKDGFYGDLKNDPDEGVRVVQDLVQKFYTDNKIYESFINAPNGFSDVDGATSVINYVVSDLEVVLVSDVAANNYMEKLQILAEQVAKLQLVKVTATQVINLEDTRYTITVASGSCGAAQSCTQSEHPSTAWGNSRHFDSGCAEIYNEPWPVAWSPIQVDLWTYAGSSPGGSFYNCAAWNTRGKITADLTSYQSGAARVYLQLTSYSVTGSDTTEFAQDRPTSAGDGEYGHWAQAEVQLGTQVTTDFVTYSDVVPTDVGTCALGSYKHYGWLVADAIVVVQPDFTSIPDPQDCCACTTCEPGKLTTALQSIHFDIGLGGENFIGSAGNLALDAKLPSVELATPSALRYSVAASVEVITNSAKTQFQFKSSQTLVNVKTNNSYKYTVSVYTAADAGTKDGSGFYQPTGSAYTTIVVENPDSGSASNHLRLTHTTESTSSVTDYTYTSDQWEMSTGGGLRKETRSSVWDSGHVNRYETNVVKNSSDQAVYQEVNVYTQFAWGEERTTNIVDPAGVALTNIWSYYTNSADPGNYRQLKQTINAYGNWVTYKYDQFGRETNRVAQFLSSAVDSAESANRVTMTSYSTNTPHITIIEKLLGTEVGRQYRVTTSGEVRDIRCQTTGAAWNASDNLVAITRKYTNGSFAGELMRVQNPDGTVQVYLYSTNATEKTTTVLAGVPDSGNETNVLRGTITTTVNGLGGEIHSRTVKYRMPGPSDFTTDLDTYTYLDARNRSYRVVHLDGTTNQYNFACCGLESEVDRDGTTTTYIYDGLKRQIGFTRNGITTTNLFDPAGAVLKTVRVGTNGSTVILSTAAYDLSGGLTNSTDALSYPTTYRDTRDSSGQRVKTTTYPNGSTRIETFNRDGSLTNITGTAVHGLHYEYGVESESGTQRSFTKEIKLNTGGSDSSEWVKTYSDMVGRSYKFVYPDAAASQTYFNSVGQTSKQVDPDGVTTLFQYNQLGELAYTAIDLNANGTIDFSSDRLTQTTNFVTTANSKDVRRTLTYVWATDGSSTATLVATVDASVDGLRTWSTNFGLASQSAVVFSGGHRYVTNTAPDGSYILSDFQNGLLLSTTRKDSSGNQLGQITYGYDPHGRQSLITDARTGATTNSFDDADRVTSVSTPAPGDGSSAQVTTTLYNNMGWAVTNGLSDGGLVKTIYHLTGEVATNSGARTYPVAYTYDYAGRLKTMKTWKDFAGNSGAATTTWNYDANRGFLSSKVHDDGKGTTNTYTAAGRPQTRAWARGVTTTFGYNAAGDLKTTVYSDTTPAATNTFDRRGRITQTTAGTTSSMLFDGAGNLLSESFTAGPLSGIILTNQYDSLLRRTNVVVQNSTTALLQQGYSYDAASRLASVVFGTNSATYAYLTNSSLVDTLTFKNGSSTRMTTSNQFDNLNRLTRKASQTGAGAVSTFNYAYNSGNQRSAITNADNSRWAYGYDSLGQVTSGKRYWSDGSLVAGQQFEYGFDDIGNRKTAASGGDEWGANLRRQVYSANNLNQYNQRTVPGYVDLQGAATNYSTVTVNLQPTYRKSEYFRVELGADNSSAPLWFGMTNVAVLTNGGGPNIVTTNQGNLLVAKATDAFQYDSDGNLTSDSLWTNSWSGENRLIAIESASGVPSGGKAKETWTHLPDGRWIERVIYSWNGSAYVAQSTNRFVWDGQVLLAILNHTNGLVTGLARGLDLSGSIKGAGGVGGVLAVNIATNGANFCAFDGNGNVSALVSATSGSVTANYEYSPFGETLRANGVVAKANPTRFSTQFADDVTGDLKYLFREDRPSWGRWLSRDPIEEGGGANLYGFIANSPTTLIDILGLADSGNRPQPIPTLPAEAVRCCDSKGLSDGLTELNKRFKQATFVAARLGLTPVTPPSQGASCKNSSRDILEFLAYPAFPKCWVCYLEERDRYPGDVDDKFSDHQAVICLGYESGGVKKQEILFDWWGDVKNKRTWSGGSPDRFRSTYRFPGQPVYDELTRRITTCSGNTLGKPPRNPPCFTCSTVRNNNP